jgi:hypothetical protein
MIGPKTLGMLGGAVFLACAPMAHAQQQPAPTAAELEQRLQEVNALLEQTRQTLAGSLTQLNQLQREVDQLRAASATAACTAPAPAPAPAPASPAQTAQATPPAPATGNDRLDALAEEQEILRSQVQQHEQTKLESASKYPVRVNGLLLFNAFSNSGAVDQIDLPSIALPQTAGQTYGAASTAGATLRQTILGLEASGPRLWGARSAASLNIDFFGDIANSLYSAPSTTVRLRLAQFGLFWTPPHGHASVEAGIDDPLISPLSPTSYATVAIPSLAWAGNLWTWSPQLRARYSRSLGVDETAGPRLGFEAGLLDPQVTGLTGTAVVRTASPGEQSRQPGVEGRAFFESGPAERPLAFGIGGYRSRQSYLNSGYPVSTTSWAATNDWRVPLGRWLSLSGEAYRGSGLGSLGGGAYKDALTGTDPSTGYARTEELDAAGGWSQLKLTLSEVLQANAAWGLDDAFAGDFHRLTLAPSTDPLTLAARDSMSVGNIIYRPKSYLILSPEYRRIVSWQITGAPSIANIFTLSMGYQF